MRTLFALRFAGPAPASRAALQFGMPVAIQVTVRVFDARGALVRELADGMFEPGWNRVTWEGNGASGSPAQPGVYFVMQLLKKFILLK